MTIVSPSTVPHPVNPSRVTVALTLPGDTLNPGVWELLDYMRELLDRAGGGAISVDAIPSPTTVDAQTTADTVDNELVLVPDSRTATLGGRELELTRMEYDLLLFFADRPRRVFTRPQLLRSVWAGSPSGVRTVDVHIRRLRAKVGERTPLITTVHGVGYRLAEHARVTVVRELESRAPYAA